jgi:hypothetical protein
MVTYTGKEFITNFVKVGRNDPELEKGLHVKKARIILVTDPARLWALMQTVSKRFLRIARLCFLSSNLHQAMRAQQSRPQRLRIAECTGQLPLRSER